MRRISFSLVWSSIYLIAVVAIVGFEISVLGWGDMDGERVYYGVAIATVLAIGGVAILRMMLNNPRLDARYLAWLKLSPWMPGQPLPLGRVGPRLFDFAVFAVVDIVRMIFVGPIAIPAVYAFAFVSGLVAAFFVMRVESLWAATLFFLPFVALDYTLWIFPPCAVAAFYLLYRANEDALRKLMVEDNWEQNIIGAEAKKQLERMPRFDAIEEGGSWKQAISVAALLALLVSFFVRDDGNPGFVVLLAAASIGRVIHYICNRTEFYLAPVNIWGRLALKRFVIPSYDRVFVVPLAVAVASVLFAGTGCTNLGVVWAWTFVCLLLLLKASPGRIAWQLTADHKRERLVTQSG